MSVKQLLSPIYFGAAMALVSTIGKWNPLTIHTFLNWDALASGLVFVILGAILLVVHKYRVNSRWREYVKDLRPREFKPSDSTKLTQNLVVPRPFAESFRLCCDSIRALDRARIIRDDAPNGTIRVRTSMTFRSFGENVEFRLKPLGEEFTEVEVRTKPLIGTTLFDYGKAVQNITSVSRFLRDKTKKLHVGELVSGT